MLTEDQEERKEEVWVRIRQLEAKRHQHGGKLNKDDNFELVSLEEELRTELN